LIPRRLCLIFLFAAAICFGVTYAGQNPGATPQKISKEDRELARSMFSTISDEVRKHYYDPKLHGLDWVANVHATEESIDNATGLNRAFTEIASALEKLNDSHTFFIPPPRPYTHDFGWQIGMIGDHCFVFHVRPGSDAATQGVKPGDEILSLNGIQPGRGSLWKINYVFNVLRPRPSLHVALRAPDGQSRELDVAAAMVEHKRVVDLTGASFEDIPDLTRGGERYARMGRMRSEEFADDLMILKFPGFQFTDREIDEIVSKASRHKALIVDLRGNPGGSVETLKAFLGDVLDHDVKIGDRMTRDGSKSLEVKSRGHRVFSGKLVVLVDSGSASSSEIFSRVMQLEKRATVLGDKTAGAVMEARMYSYKLGMGNVVFYGAQITDADLIMTDGKSLDRRGVTPDELILPSAPDLAAGRDPVMARAAELCGVKMNPEAAGSIFPYEWAPL
jgi:carboxyl-terminal processing protease